MRPVLTFTMGAAGIVALFVVCFIIGLGKAMYNLYQMCK